jgi:hypothetical protein
MAPALPCALLRPAGSWLLAAAALACTSPAAAQRVRVAQLTDLAFGTIGTAPVDTVLTDNLCVYSTATSGRYTITARGSGSSNSFALASGGNSLPYEVQWAFASGRTSGTALTPNVALAGTTANRLDSTCTLSSSLTATLVVVLRASAQQSARAGAYSGTLTLIVAPN